MVLIPLREASQKASAKAALAAEYLSQKTHSAKNRLRLIEPKRNQGCLLI